MRKNPTVYTLTRIVSGKKIHGYGTCSRCGEGIQSRKSKFCWTCFRASAKQPIQRFWEHVNKTKGCWLWTGAVSGSNFYGNFWNGKRYIGAHRYSWIIHNGDVPNGLFVLHKCDIPRCVNPTHLWLGTMLENVKDKVQKGRAIGPHHKLTENDVRKIREMKRSGMRTRDIAAAFDVTKRTIHTILSGRYWKHVV